MACSISPQFMRAMNADLTRLLPRTVLVEVRWGRRCWILERILNQNPFALRVLSKVLLKKFAAPEQTTHHRSHRAFKDFRDLFVRELLEIREDDDQAKIDRKPVDRPQHVI